MMVRVVRYDHLASYYSHQNLPLLIYHQNKEAETVDSMSYLLMV